MNDPPATNLLGGLDVGWLALRDHCLTIHSLGDPEPGGGCWGLVIRHFRGVFSPLLTQCTAATVVPSYLILWIQQYYKTWATVAT